MQTIKQEYKQFLTDNFNGLRLRPGLFYSWNCGLRFDLQVDDIPENEYFAEVTRRASMLFQSAFNDSDKVFLIFTEGKYRRKKIRFSNFIFKQIDQLEKTDVFYLKEKSLYERTNIVDIKNVNVAITKLNTKRINYKNILTAIGNSDFPPRQPRLDEKRFPSTSKRVYFINLNKKLIFQMYDDRGLDLIAADKEILRLIYKKHNEWLLDYDRKQMDNLFAEENAL